MDRYSEIDKINRRFKYSMGCTVQVFWKGNNCDLTVRYSDMSGTATHSEIENLTDGEILYCYALGIGDR